MHKVGELLGWGGILAVEVRSGSCGLVLHADHQWNQDVIVSLKVGDFIFRKFGALEVKFRHCLNYIGFL